MPSSSSSSRSGLPPRTRPGLGLEDWLLDPHDCPGFLRAEYLHVRIPRRYALVNLTEKVEAVLNRSGVTDGLCFVSAMHITAGVYVNDAESGLLMDIAGWIEGLAPYGLDYRHHRTGEDNGDAHLKSYLTNHSLTAPITAGHLDFGTWQQIFYAEFDGHRDKRVLVKILGISSRGGPQEKPRK